MGFAVHSLCGLSFVEPRMVMSRLWMALLFSLAANLLAEVVLRFRYVKLFSPFTPAQQRRRLLRWVLCCASVIVLALFTHLNTPQLILATLFSITAATDFECKRLPWDWFLYGSVIAGIGVAYGSHGWLGFRDAVIAQAILFAAMTLTVIFLRQTAGGDIKMMMQYGAACGNITLAMTGIVISGLAMLAVSLIFRLITHRPLTRVPLAPTTWIGFLAVMLMGGFNATALL